MGASVAQAVADAVIATKVSLNMRVSALPDFMLLLAVSAIASAVHAAPTDGAIVSRRPVAFPTAEQMARFREKDPAYATAVENLHMEAITYLSDGLKVKGLMALPNGPGPFPAIIFNRGGNREFGGLDPRLFAARAAMFVQAGYAIVGSDYRGNGGGEGREEFGGADVDDVIALIPLLHREPKIDSRRIGVYGSSRGGLMTYEALARTSEFKAAVVESGLSDSFQTVNDRPEMETGVYRELIPDFARHREEALRARSPVLWADKLSHTTPILVLHGTADWRVGPHDALAISRALLDARIPFRLVMFEGGSHGDEEFADEQERMEIEWFNRYLRDRAPLPNLTPHGP
jgi:dipeptidyl aminopeptidase/acylaminoacyl peptidase